jgi:hypothetical protein
MHAVAVTAAVHIRPSARTGMPNGLCTGVNCTAADQVGMLIVIAVQRFRGMCLYTRMCGDMCRGSTAPLLSVWRHCCEPTVTV